MLELVEPQVAPLTPPQPSTVDTDEAKWPVNPFLVLFKEDGYLISRSSVDGEANATKPNETETGSVEQEFVRYTPPVRVEAITPSKEMLTVRALQRWTGRVQRVLQDRFIAIVSDVTTPTNPDEEIELDIEDVPIEDRGLIAEGAIFYWSMVYRDSKAGQREKSESIRFARQPKLSEQDVQDIFGDADAITAILEGA